MSTRLILTHENADFDAISSLLAMYKLDPTAIPVLPSHINPNVRNFMTLYAKSLLPARQRDDIRRQHIELAYVVDTQSFNSVKGLRKDTPLIYIDHHPLGHELEPHETYEGEIVGANVTLLVERIQQQSIKITPPEATCLILGIYEDTGSLTYGSTTVRDMQAATWLLEQGADLDKVRKFLSHPLTDDLVSIYDELLQNTHFVEIGGHPILLATAHTDKQISHLAALTQKLRELYDPNALVMLIQVSDDVQFIGRSGISAIDIGQLARYLGGGGHTRAAAAILQNRTVEDVLTQVYQHLERIVQPMVRVSEIMSSGHIFTLNAQSTIAQAISATKHTSHEGYPVLRDGQVIGLLTRQAMDRAKNHNILHEPITTIMKAGEIFVKSNDSFEYLRKQMMESGWGQMPVVDEAGQVIGIATRTDLIRLWNESLTETSRGGMLIGQLEQFLPPSLWDLVMLLTHEAQKQNIGLYLVGGFVRDLLLEVPNLDIDFVIEGNAIDFVTHLQAQLGGDMRHHTRFNTAKWLLDEQVVQKCNLTEMPASWPQQIDFATARTEFYDQPTILPTVRESSIKLDLHRRDFTINALAVRLSPEPAGELLDYYNGERDLQDGLIRVLHSLSFVDDPTRMMRAIRFEQRLDFNIEPRTVELFEAALPLIQRVSGDRLRNELNLMLAEPVPLKNLRRLSEMGILRELHPRLRMTPWIESACQAVVNFRQAPRWELADDFDNWRVSLFGLLILDFTPAELDDIGQKLALAQTNLRHYHAVQTVYATMQNLAPDVKPSWLYELLGGFGDVEWIILWAGAVYAYQRRLIEQFVNHWRHLQPNYDGNHLLAMGLKPGPIIGDILSELRRAWLDGEITTAAEEDRLVAQLIATGETHDA